MFPQEEEEEGEKKKKNTNKSSRTYTDFLLQIQDREVP
jgi:hypothetical protein